MTSAFALHVWMVHCSFHHGGVNTGILLLEDKKGGALSVLLDLGNHDGGFEADPGISLQESMVEIIVSVL